MTVKSFSKSPTFKPATDIGASVKTPASASPVKTPDTSASSPSLRQRYAADGFTDSKAVTNQGREVALNSMATKMADAQTARNARQLDAMNQI